MPLISSKYKARGLFTNSHFNTIYSSFVRNPDFPPYERATIETPDGDFFHADRILSGNKQCLVILHGLVGNSDSRYMRGMTKHFNDRGFDICVINARCCTGVPNRTIRTFHAGFSEDTDTMMNILEKEGQYEKIAMVGFSMGGSILLNYLTRDKHKKSETIKCAIAISTPLLLEEGAELLMKPTNRLYMEYFRRKINRIARMKEKQLADHGIDVEDVYNAKDFFELDTLYTAKIFGFENGLDYYRKSSVVNRLDKLVIPTLLINAADDMMLGPSSYPVAFAEESNLLYFEMNLNGGHMGYQCAEGVYFDQRSFQFITKHIS